MAKKVGNIAPFINNTFYVTSPWWTERSGTIHRGLDIATSTSKEVYSILNGIVHSIGYDDSQGNWIIIWDNNSSSETYGYATLYMHLAERPSLAIGQAISKNDFVGMEGTTGESTGIHLHVEMQDISRFNNNWHWSYNKSDYLDPTQYMGIDNIKDTSWYYDGTPSPSYREKKKFPWVLYSNRIRNKRNLLN